MASSAITFPSPPRRIVVGVDAAPSSDDAVRAGFALSTRLGVGADLVHALRLPDYSKLRFDPARAQEIVRILRTNAEHALDARVRPLLPASVAAALGDASPVRIVEGHPAAVLLDEAQQGSALLVLGGHRKRGLFHFENTVRSILAKSRRAVWIQSVPVRPIATVLAAVDLSDDSLRALACARDLARQLGAELHVVHCFDVLGWAVAGFMEHGGDAAVERMRSDARDEFARQMEAFDWHGIEHSVEFVDAHPTDAIVERSRAADLAVLGTHGRTGFAAVVLGSVAAAVLRAAECPLLVVPNPERRFLA